MRRFLKICSMVKENANLDLQMQISVIPSPNVPNSIHQDHTRVEAREPIGHCARIMRFLIPLAFQNGLFGVFDQIKS